MRSPSPWWHRGLAPAVVDPTASRVVDRERGLLNRIAAVFQHSSTSEQEVYHLAQARLNEAANASDLARRSQENTRQMLTTPGPITRFSQRHRHLREGLTATPPRVHNRVLRTANAMLVSPLPESASHVVETTRTGVLMLPVVTALQMINVKDG